VDTEEEMIDIEIGENNLATVLAGGSPACRLDYSAPAPLASGRLLELRVSDGRVAAENDFLEIEDELKHSGGLIVISRRWTIKKAGNWQLSFRVAPFDRTLTGLVIPALMYHDNLEGEGKFPRGGLKAGWSFREDRMPVPSCAVLFGGVACFAVFTEPARSEADISSIRAYMTGDGPAFEIRVPFSEEPFSYCEKGLVFGGLRKARHRRLKIAKSRLPFIYDRKFYVKTGEYGGSVFRIFNGLTRDAFAEIKREEPKAETDWGRIASLKLHNLLFLTVDDREKGIAGVQQGRGNPPLVQHAYENVAGSFLTRGLEAAYIYAALGIELGSSRLLDLSERIGRFFLKGAMENGLHQDFYKFSEGRMSGYHMPLDATTREMREGANARCNGEAMLNYLRLYGALKKAGRDIPEFLDIVKKNADFYIRNQIGGEQEGSFGRWWGRDGRPINTNGTNGAHIIPMLVELEKAAGKSEEVDRALDRAANYYGSLAARGEYYGDTLDADCTDKEAGVVLLRAFLDLYERGGKKEHLETAIDAASFVLSWTWAYDIPFDPRTPLGRQGFRTTGMTSVSVGHHHLDFYGLSPACDFLRLWEATGDGSWKEYAMAMINSCAQLISCPGDLLDRSGKYAGYQPEKIYQTEWNYLLLEIGGKGHWDTCIAWVVVLTLGAMLDIRRRFPGILDFSFDRRVLEQLDPEVIKPGRLGTVLNM
jgi:hypothetical protein